MRVSCVSLSVCLSCINISVFNSIYACSHMWNAHTSICRIYISCIARIVFSFWAVSVESVTCCCCWLRCTSYALRHHHHRAAQVLRSCSSLMCFYASTVPCLSSVGCENQVYIETYSHTHTQAYVICAIIILCARFMSGMIFVCMCFVCCLGHGIRQCNNAWTTRKFEMFFMLMLLLIYVVSSSRGSYARASAHIVSSYAVRIYRSLLCVLWAFGLNYMAT